MVSESPTPFLEEIPDAILDTLAAIPTHFKEFEPPERQPKSVEVSEKYWQKLHKWVRKSEKYRSVASIFGITMTIKSSLPSDISAIFVAEDGKIVAKIREISV